MDDRHARHRRTDADRRRRPVEGYRALGEGRFLRLVEQAVAGLPRGLLAYLDEVEVNVEEIPPPDVLGSADPLVLSRYQPEAGASGTPPGDRLTLYRRPLEARAVDKRDLAQLVQDAVVSELVQRFGLDDDRLDELGWS